MPTCLIALGANLGDRRQTLDRVARLLAEEPGVRFLKTSRFIETTPVGGPTGQPPFLNGAAILETSLAPEAVLAVLQRIEGKLGRQRTKPWGPRPVDLDLLLYDQELRRTPALELPHPRMAWRRFVLEPAAEIAGTMVHPTIGWSVAQLLAHLNTAHHYVAIAGGIGVDKAYLAARLAIACSAERIIEQINPRLWRRFHADPSGHAWPAALECLRRRTQLLASDVPNWSDRRRLRVSDFWFDESRAFARTWLPIDQRKRFFAAWQRARFRVASPKLIVLLDAPSPRLCGPTVRRDCSPWDRAAQAVLEEVAKPNVGPVLRLAEGDPDAMLAEVVAAVESMR